MWHAGPATQLLTSQSAVLESMLHCITHAWPCILVGAAATGALQSQFHEFAALYTLDGATIQRVGIHDLTLHPMRQCLRVCHSTGTALCTLAHVLD